MIKYTKEIDEYIKNHCVGNKPQNLVDALKKEFNFDTTINGLRAYMSTKGYRFTTHKIAEHKNWNQRKVGDFRTKKGLVQIKVAEPNVWKQYQVYLWEKYHKQKVKKGEVVIFLDKNTRNFNIENLYKVSRKVLGYRAINYSHIEGINGYQLSELKCLISDKRKEIKNETN